MVSVIIPIFKVEEYLRECVDSVINQTYADLEIILVDDGSPDNCGKICDEYEKIDSRVKVIHKENGGLSDARNAGLSIASGEYVYFLDSDDYLRNDAIEQLVATANKELADIVGFGAIMFSVNKGSKLLGLQLTHEYVPSSGAVILRQRFSNGEWEHGVPFQFFRTVFLREEGLLFKKDILYEDVLFTGIAYTRAKRVAVLSEALYYYRIRDDSIMNSRRSCIYTHSAYECFFGLTTEKQRYLQGSSEEAALDIQIKHSAWLFINLFCELEKKDRQKADGERRTIQKEIKKITTLNCRRIALKYRFPRVWSIGRRAFGD